MQGLTPGEVEATRAVNEASSRAAETRQSSQPKSGVRSREAVRISFLEIGWHGQRYWLARGFILGNQCVANPIAPMMGSASVTKTAIKNKNPSNNCRFLNSTNRSVIFTAKSET